MDKIVNFFKKKNTPFLIGSIWIVFITIGFISLLTYSNKSGEVGKTSSDWPVGTSVVKNLTGFTLLLFSHPKCPCTRATAAELERLIAQVDGKPVMTYVLLYNPSDVAEGWSKTDLRKKFETIPNVHVLLDTDGVEAGRFGAMTSGQTFLYSKEGKLLFKGGITPSRGHEGDNVGRDSIVSLIVNNKVLQSETHVFGCSIRKPASLGWKAK